MTCFAPLLANKLKYKRALSVIKRLFDLGKEKHALNSRDQHVISFTTSLVCILESSGHRLQNYFHIA